MATSLDLAARLAAVVRTQQDVLAAITDLEQVMALVVERVPDVTSGNGAVIEMREGDQLVYRAASGSAKEHVGLRLDLGSSLSGLAVREKVIVQCEDTETDMRVDGAACRRIGIRSMIIAPITENGDAVGALKSFSPRAQAFNDLDLYALQLLAGMTSGALTQARAFRERRASEERYRLLFDRNVAGVFRTTRDGRILDCNEAFVRTLGYDARDEVLHLTAWDLYHQRTDREQLIGMLEQSGTLTQLRVALRRKDGSSMLAVVNASLVVAEGEEPQVLGTVVEA